MKYKTLPLCDILDWLGKIPMASAIQTSHRPRSNKITHDQDQSKDWPKSFSMDLGAHAKKYL